MRPGPAVAYLGHHGRVRSRRLAARRARSGSRRASPAARSPAARRAPAAAGRVRRWRRRRARPALDDEAHAVRRAARRPHLRRGRRRSATRSTARELDAEVLGVEAGEVEQVGDQPVQPLRLAEHDLADLRGLLGGDDAVGERLGVPGDRGQRRAQVVRHRQQELALPRLGVRERAGQGVDRVAPPRRPRPAPPAGTSTSRRPLASACAAAAVRRSGRASRQATSRPSSAAMTAAISSATTGAARPVGPLPARRPGAAPGRCRRRVVGRPSTNTLVPSTVRRAEIDAAGAAAG